MLRVCTAQMAFSQAHRFIVEAAGRYSSLGKTQMTPLAALRQAAKSLTLILASYPADFVAETLRASKTPQGGLLTDEENIHNASGDGERKRPCSGFVKIVAKPRRAKTRVHTVCVADWMGGLPSQLLDDLALSPTSYSGAGEQRA